MGHSPPGRPASLTAQRALDILSLAMQDPVKPHKYTVDNFLMPDEREWIEAICAAKPLITAERILKDIARGY